MNFADAMRNDASRTYTENGAVALNTTGNACLDLFSTIGALRTADDNRIERLFADAYNEDALTATKIAFYARDVRGGLGERHTFRVLLKYMAKHHKEALLKNLDLIGVYGRYDDLYALVGTPLEGKMWQSMKTQLNEDIENMKAGRAVSLLGKWMKSANTSSKESRALGHKTALMMGYALPAYRKLLSRLRNHIGIIEGYMSRGEWDKIKYSEVPSRAMMIYKNSFTKHDSVRFSNFISSALTGETKINSSTLYPYDLVERARRGGWGIATEDDTVEAQWRQLPNYVDGEANAIVIADTSGSMIGRPMNTSIGLAIYFAERNKGAYHNMWMSFSERPKIHVLRGETLAQKINSLDMNDWDSNTNLRLAFEKILDIAVKNNTPQEELPKSLIVISDMEIDASGNSNWTFYDSMRARYLSLGYDIPTVIFWNVDSRHDVFHADKTKKGVQLVSGQSTSIFKQVMSCVGMTPTEAMYKTINSERYNAITI